MVLESLWSDLFIISDHTLFQLAHARTHPEHYLIPISANAAANSPRHVPLFHHYYTGPAQLFHLSLSTLTLKPLNYINTAELS